MKPILILAHPGDRLALQVYAELQRQVGSAHLRLHSAQEIALALRWSHHQNQSGIRTEIGLADGSTIEGEWGLLFNRLQQLELPHFGGADPMDRDYAAAEMQALLLSWLHSLSCPVINPASAQGLGGARRTHAQWLQLAQQAGLPIQAYHFSSNPRRFSPRSQSTASLWPYRTASAHGASVTPQLERITLPQVGSEPTFFLEQVADDPAAVVVAGEQVVGGAVQLDRAACRRLTQLAGVPLLQITLARRTAGATNEWAVCGVSPFPDAEDAHVVRAIADFLLLTATSSPRSGFAMEPGAAPQLGPSEQ